MVPAYDLHTWQRLFGVFVFLAARPRRILRRPDCERVGAAGQVPAGLPGWGMSYDEPEPTLAHPEAGATLDLRQHRLTYRFLVRKSELEFQRFHADIWRNRLMCCIGFSLLVSTPHSLGELLNPGDRVVTSFGGLALQAFPGMANQVVAFTVLVRYVLVGLIGAACYTRFDPMRKSYDLVACSMVFCVIISKIAPPIFIVLRDATPHPELWTNTTLEAFPSSAKIATNEMMAWSCFTFFLAVSGMSPLAYLVRLSRARRTRPLPHHAPTLSHIPPSAGDREREYWSVAAAA